MRLTLLVEVEVLQALVQVAGAAGRADVGVGVDRAKARDSGAVPGWRHVSRLCAHTRTLGSPCRVATATGGGSGPTCAVGWRRHRVVLLFFDKLERNSAEVALILNHQVAESNHQLLSDKEAASAQHPPTPAHTPATDAEELLQEAPSIIYTRSLSVWDDSHLNAQQDTVCFFFF